jgi:hypothetical protein
MPRYFTCSSVRVEVQRAEPQPEFDLEVDRWQIGGLARLGREGRLRWRREDLRRGLAVPHHGT